MVGPIDVKRKWSASFGYWVEYVTFTVDLTHVIDFEFWYSTISGHVVLISVKWIKKEAQQIDTGPTMWHFLVIKVMMLAWNWKVKIW